MTMPTPDPLTAELATALRHGAERDPVGVLLPLLRQLIRRVQAAEARVAELEHNTRQIDC